MFGPGSIRPNRLCIGGFLNGSIYNRTGKLLMFSPGQDVFVTFDGEEYQGEVLENTRGWVMARVLVDPNTDHGRVTPMLGLSPIVNVRESDVRLPEADHG